MAFHFSELLTKLCFSVIFLLSVFTIIILLYVAGSTVSFLTFFAKESIQKAGKAPITGTVFHQLFYFNTLFDYQTDTARKHPTFRVIMPSHNDIYTTNPANIEHILKTNFSIYTKGWHNYNIVRDLLGDGIFAVDGDKWRSQRKLASHEFSTKVLREFSSVVFRTTGAKLAKKIGEAASSTTVFDMQVCFVPLYMKTIWKYIRFRSKAFFVP